jgi:lactam utilization protein B
LKLNFTLFITTIVWIGAHPGLNDLWGFGRRQIKMSARDLDERGIRVVPLTEMSY